MPWSHACISQREEESKSTSYVNGQVKTYVKFHILDSFNNTEGQLPAIIARAARKNVKTVMHRAEKSRNPSNPDWGTHWQSGEHFYQKFTQVCQIFGYVAIYALLR